MSTRRVALALILSVLMVGSAVTAAVGTSHGSSAGSADAADDVYVNEDGDAVLVYEGERSPDDESEGQFGASIEENLVYALVTEPVDEAPDERGELSVRAEPSLLTATGALSVPQPEEVREFDLDASGVANEDDAYSDFDLTAEFVDESGMGAFVRSITTDGEMSMGADRFYLDGDFEARAIMPMGEDERFAMSLREGDDEYTIDVEERRTVREWGLSQWENRTVAEETIRENYGLGEDVDGSVDVTFSEYSLSEADDGSHRLETAYTVTYRDVDEAFSRMIADELATEPGVTEEDAERFAAAFREASIEEASVTFEMQGATVSGDLTLDLRDYDGLVESYFDVAMGLQGEGAPAGNLEQAREQFEAQRAADLEQRYEWSGELTTEDDGALALDVDFTHRTTNWAEYVSELRERDVPWHASEYELTGTSDGDRIELDGSMRLEGEDLFETLFGQFDENAFAGGDASPQAGGSVAGPEMADQEMAETLQSLSEAQPRVAKFEVSYDEDGLRMETGASFGNLAALRDTVAAEAGAPEATGVTEVAGRTGDEGEVTHVHVDGAVGADPSESDVRALEFVGESTAVHMPGEWDRDFHRMDVEQAEAFLDDAESDGGLGPGFGVGLAALAVLVAAMIAARRL